MSGAKWKTKKECRYKQFYNSNLAIFISAFEVQSLSDNTQLIILCNFVSLRQKLLKLEPEPVQKLFENLYDVENIKNSSCERMNNLERRFVPGR